MQRLIRARLPVVDLQLFQLFSLLLSSACAAPAPALSAATGAAGTETAMLPISGAAAAPSVLAGMAASVGGTAASALPPAVAGRLAAAAGAAAGTQESAAVGGNGAAAVGGMGAAAAGGMSAGAGGHVLLPSMRDGKFQLEFGTTAFEIDPQQGGRITKFALGGQNLLTGPEVDPLNWGSTFWPSPQERWNWPPVPELDSQPFEFAIDGDQIVLTSGEGTRAKVRVQKRIRADLTHDAIEISYVLTNSDSAPVSWAGWEISRVAPGGLTFFRTGDRDVTRSLPVIESNGVTWYKHDPLAVGKGQKFSADGRGGWLAHVAGKLLYVKTFDDLTLGQQAPAPEAEIEIYAAPGYVELEPQGAYTQLMPGQTLRFVVRWYVRAIPDSVELTVGSAELVAFAEAVVRP